MTQLIARRIHYWAVAFQLILLLPFAASDLAFRDSCSDYKQFRRRPKDITSSNKYGLWPGLTSSTDLENGEVIFGFDEVDFGTVDLYLFI